MYTHAVFGAMPLMVAALAIAAADVKNPALAEGIRLYDSLDYAGALQALTQALDRPSSRPDSARIHLYIGLIQNRYKLKQDAEASFGRAIDFDPRVRLPKGTPQSAKVVFKRIKKDKLGIDDDAPVEPVKKKKIIKKRTNQEGGGGDEEGEGPDEEATHTSTAAQSTALAMNSSNSSNASNASNGSTDNITEPTRSDPPRLERQEADHRIVPPTSRAEVNAGSSTPIVAYIAIGVSLAAAATGATFAVLSSKNGNAAQNEPVASRAEALHTTAVQQRTFAFVSFGVSSVTLGLAAVLFLTE